MGGGLYKGIGCARGPGSEAANLPQSHVDSDSSSSHSHQETPPSAAAAPIVTVESASGFGPATPPQRRRSSAQVGLPGKGGRAPGSRSGRELRPQRGKKSQILRDG